MNPFKINYSDKDQVITFAKALGPGMTVFKHPSRSNYNITHSVRKDMFKPEWVVFQS